MEIVIKYPAASMPEIYRGDPMLPIPWENVPRAKHLMISIDPPASVSESIAALERAGMPAGYGFSRLWVSRPRTYMLIERLADE
jgi:hypothetical protein